MALAEERILGELLTQAPARLRDSVMKWWILAATLLLVPACDVGDSPGGQGSSKAEQCSTILQWSFQEGNALSDHPREDWYRKNCD